jgi:hypothetical protein
MLNGIPIKVSTVKQQLGSKITQPSLGFSHPFTPLTTVPQAQCCLPACDFTFHCLFSFSIQESRHFGRIEHIFIGNHPAVNSQHGGLPAEQPALLTPGERHQRGDQQPGQNKNYNASLESPRGTSG